MATEDVHGYHFGKPQVPRSPVTLRELHELEATLGWSDEDMHVLARHRDIFEKHAEEMVDTWRAVIASQPHLAKWFFGPDGKPDEAYKAGVKKRFVQWVRDVVSRPHDQAWLDYQEEIGLRHTPVKKNKTEGVHTPDVVPLRFLVAFVPLVTMSTRKFFAAVPEGERQKLEDAWMKAVQLHLTLWTRAYAKQGLW
jgi:protoglobin